jgi:hypothetical protein
VSSSTFRADAPTPPDESADWPVLRVPESATLLCSGVVDLFAEFNLAGLYKIPLCVEVIVGSQMEHCVVHVSRAGGDVRATRERENQFARRAILALEAATCSRP